MADHCFPDYDDRDDCADGAQQLLEYNQYVDEQQRKAVALLALPAAHDLARKAAEDLAALVRKHAAADGDTTLAYMLRDTGAELVVTETLEGRASVLEQPLTRDGFIAIRKVLDGACEAFEELLQTTRAY